MRFLVPWQWLPPPIPAPRCSSPAKEDEFVDLAKEEGLFPMGVDDDGFMAVVLYSQVIGCMALRMAEVPCKTVRECILACFNMARNLDLDCIGI